MKWLHSWLHRVWVSLTGAQWWMSISCSLISSPEFTKVFVYCPDTWDRNSMPPLSTHTLTSSTFTASSIFNPGMKWALLPFHWRPVLCLCFVNFIPKNMLHGTLRVYETLYFRRKKKTPVNRIPKHRLEISTHWGFYVCQLTGEGEGVVNYPHPQRRCHFLQMSTAASNRKFQIRKVRWQFFYHPVYHQCHITHKNSSGQVFMIASTN